MYQPNSVKQHLNKQIKKIKKLSMLDENVGYKKPSTTDLYLVEPTTKLGYQFATLRNLLDRNRIPFITILGYEGLIDLLNGNSGGHKNMIVVNSTDINEREIPKQISNRNNNEIYFYPNYIPAYDHLLNADTVINTFKNKSGMNNNRNQSSTGFQLRSIKKDLQHSQQRQNNKQVYQRYMIMSPKTNHNIEYTRLYNLLQNYNSRIIPISKQNQIMNYKETKSLLVLEKQSLDSINQLVIGNRMRNLDLAVLGQSKVLGSQFKKYAILTQDPLQIISYLQQSGLSLQGAQNKYNLIRQTNIPLNTNNLISQPNSLRLVGSEQDLNNQQNALNLNQNTNMNMNGPNNLFTAPQNNIIANPSMNVAVNSSAFANNAAINNNMNINSNLNNGVMIASPSTQKPKVIKKMKGNSPASLINSPNMEDSQQIINLKNPINLQNQIEVGERPINIQQNQIQSQQTAQMNQNNQMQYIQNNPSLQLTPNFGSGKKNVMHWYLQHNNQLSMVGNKPGFILSQQPNFSQTPPMNNNSIKSIQMQPMISSPSSSQIPTFKSMQNNQRKPVMNWNLFPVIPSNGSKKISFNLINQDANFINKNQLGSAQNIPSGQSFKQFSNQNIPAQVLPLQPNIPQISSQPQIKQINQASSKGNIPQAPMQNSFNLNPKQQMHWYALPNLGVRSQNQQINSGQNKIPFHLLSQQEILINNQQNLQNIQNTQNNTQSFQNISSGQSFKQLPHQNNPVQMLPLQPQPQRQSINQAPSIGNIPQAPLQNDFILNSKPQMHWYLHPSNGQRSKQQSPHNSSKIPFELISEQQLNKNKQNNTIDSINSMIQSKKQPPKPPQQTSKQSINIQSNKIISQQLQQNITSQRIQNKYNKQLNLNLIKQSSDEHHGSHMSFPIDQTAQRISINKNSNKSINLHSQNYINQVKIQQQLQRAQYQNKNAKSQQLVIPRVPYDQPKRLLPQAPQTYYIESTQTIQNRVNNPLIAPAISISQNMKRHSLPINQVTTTTITNNISNPSYTNYTNYKIQPQPIPTTSQTVTYTYNINNPPINHNKEIKFNTNTQNTVNIINTNSNYNYGKYMGEDTSRNGSQRNSNIVENQIHNKNIKHTHPTHPTHTHGDAVYQNYYTNYYNSKGNTDFYDVSTDQNGNRFYRIKRHYLNNPNTYLNQNPTTQILDRYKSAPKPQTVTYTTNNNPKIEPSLPLSPRQPIRRQSNFNINDYQEHVDDKGRKYYRAKQSIINKLGTNIIGQSKKIQQTYKLQQIQTPQQYKSPSQTLMIQSKNQSINNKQSPNYSPNSPNFSSSSQYTDNNFQKYTNYTRQQIRHSTYQSPNTAIDKYQRRYTDTNPGTALPIKTGIQQKIMNKLLGKNDNIKVEDYSTKHPTKQLTNPTYQYLNNNNDVYNQYHHHQKQSHHHHHHHKHHNRASKLKNSNNEIVSDRNTIKDSRNSYANHQSPTESKLSRESLNIDSRSVSMTGNKNLYGDKPYFSSTANVRIQNYSQLQKVTKQFKNLDVGGNYFHYIVYNKHPMKKQILSSAGVQDKVISIQHRDQVYEYMEKKPFPNQFYDAGLIFIDHNPNFQHQIQPSKIVNGYYIIDIDSSNPQIDIKKQRKSINISNVRNLPLVKKLLLAPSIQHFIFYPRGNDGDISKVLSLFPSKKFQKYSYSNKLQLQTHLNMHLKNRNRLTRILIFVNPNNINEIAPVLDHKLNNKSFTMICNNRGPVEQSYKNQYKKIKFFDNFDFNSYGSVMSLANGEDGVRHSRYSTPRQHQQFKQSKFQRVSVNSSEYSPEHHNSPQAYTLTRPKIYIQRPHKGIDKQIQKSRPGIYQIKYFNNPSQIKQASRDNYVLLHGQADNIGQKFNRDMGMIILFGPGNQKKQRISDGVINIEKVSELINSVL